MMIALWIIGGIVGLVVLFVIIELLAVNAQDRGDNWFK